MKRVELLFGVLRVPLDVLAVAGSLLLAYALRARSIDLVPGVQLLEAPTTLPSPGIFLETFVIPGVAIFLFIAGLLRLYALQSSGSAWREAGRTIEAACLWLVLVMTWYFLVRKELFYSRILLLHGTIFIALSVNLGRGALILVQRALQRLGIGVHAVCSVGAQELTPHVRAALERDRRYRYLGHAKDLAALRSLAGAEGLDTVLHTDPDPSDAECRALIEYCRSEHIRYGYLPPVFADAPHQLTIERLGLTPLVYFRPTPLDGWGRVFKRGFDVVAGTLLVLALSPLLLFCAIAVLLEDGGPVFYVSRRVTEGGKGSIRVLKFRSMVKDADRRKAELLAQNHRADGPLFKMRGDPRVTRVGRVLRRWSLDELPQLLNVIAGQMSLVGPRPHLPDEVRRYNTFQRRVFAVRPGVTGLAQISGRSDLSFEEEVRLDLQYIEEWSLVLDLWVLWRTPFVVLGRRGAD